MTCVVVVLMQHVTCMHGPKDGTSSWHGGQLISACVFVLHHCQHPAADRPLAHL